MRIIYVARHDSGGNDDEGAIYHALVELGHDVQRLRELNGRKAHKLLPADLCLFHKWDDADYLRSYLVGRVPLAFWYFDLVNYPDPTIARRCWTRMEWMRRIMPLVDVGFCTDGDWVAKHPEKLHWLPQGADGRIVDRGDPKGGRACDVLFTGASVNCGVKRQSFVEEMNAKYGGRLLHVTSGMHREWLRDAIAAAKIVVAPDGPITDRYWSNRIYNVLGFGGFLLHPYCEQLSNQYDVWGHTNTEGVKYKVNRHVVFYYTREHFHQLIDYYLTDDAQRIAVADRGYRRTILEHLYLHRCEELIRVVKECCHV